MLGQQQIAGVPTAISELFKNAHDAYATTVEVDYFRSDGLFVLRDDGVGMTAQDFESRWLVLGTESKIDAPTLAPPYQPSEQARRPMLGEKGIGRLAIGAIGPQVLVLTRALREDGLGDLVVAFVNWTFFSLPGVHLDDIDIPMQVLPGGTIPDASVVAELLDGALASFAAIEARGVKVPPVVAEELASFATAVDIPSLASSLSGPSLLGEGHGTQFYIVPSTPTLAADIDGGLAADAAPPLTKFLLGFTNTMTPGHEQPRIEARFRDWRSDDAPTELIADSEFFTADEFEAADHHITGHFDGFGQFKGTVAVYGSEPVEHVVTWPDSRGRLVACGPFNLRVAVVQGRQNQTRLDPELWAQLTAKMTKIGGLYIYRDGIRVLPYGNNDYDFIDIERNRTKNAARYYFSFRRMFGVIELDTEHNGALKEKAGREGFRENQAYTDFRRILMNFFIQTAADFFREEGTASDAYRQQREQFEKADAARQRREQLRSSRRREFQGLLGERLGWLDEDRPTTEVADFLSKAKDELTRSASLGAAEQAAAAFMDAELAVRRGLDDVRESYRLRPPSQTGLSIDVKKDWNGYRAALQRLDDELFIPAKEELGTLIEQTAATLAVHVDRRVRLEKGIARSADTVRSVARKEAGLVRASLSAVTTSTRDLISGALRDLDVLTERAASESASADVEQMEDAEFERWRRQLEQSVLVALDERTEQFKQLQSRLDSVAEATTDGDLVDVEALDQDEILALRERTDTDLELMQLGTAISVINHEFLGNVRSLRSNLQRLKVWADRNEGLGRVYRDLRTSFDHLDGYLSLFTPLQRRLHRKRVEIIGADIERFITELFSERLERHNVHLEATPRFRDHRFDGYPSTFYPVFVNLVDNAIWWLGDRPHRAILLQARDGIMSVIDSGPGVPVRDYERIFEFGFTRKPDGRGTGLYVSRQVLRREHHDLRVRADDQEGLGGAAFDIVEEPANEAAR
jgi:signal transduction histidine kinase